MINIDEAIEYVERLVEQDVKNIDSTKDVLAAMSDFMCLQRLKRGKRLFEEIEKSKEQTNK